MKRPGKPRITTKSFVGLIWKNGRIERKTFDDVLREVYTPDIMTSLLPDSSLLWGLLAQ